MATIEQVCGSLAQLAPLRLAESWDNVGLLIGDRSATVTKVMTCLTVTPDVVDEAASEGAGLIVAHHPLPFKPLAKITADSVTGSMVLQLISSGIALYSAHTAFDSAVDGINDQWCAALGVENAAPLIKDADNDTNAGRYGQLPEPISQLAAVRAAATAAGATLPRMVGDPERLVSRIAFACGSGGTFLGAALRRGCDLLISGEATFHTCLEARSSGIGLGLVGHYSSERFAMEQLAARLSELQSGLKIWPSRCENDPIVPVNLH